MAEMSFHPDRLVDRLKVAIRMAVRALAVLMVFVRAQHGWVAASGHAPALVWSDVDGVDGTIFPPFGL